MIQRLRSRWRWTVASALLATLVVGLVLSASAADEPGGKKPVRAAAEAPKPAEADPVTPTDVPGAGGGRGITRVYSLGDLGAQTAVQLRGVDAYSSFNFGIRSDEVVTDARLVLKYTYSPSLLPDVSHLNVIINGEIIDTIPLLRERAVGEQVRAISIPPRLLSDFTQFTLQFIGHYTRTCEDPFHSSLWLNVSRSSSLTLKSVRVQQPDDLALLPEPFFDRRDPTRLRLPFVFEGTPSRTTLEAAGIAASWFGILAGYRGAQFDHLSDELPRVGYGVVFLTGPSKLLPDLAEPEGPAVAMVTNPNDASAKLLVFMGRDEKELKTATTAVAFGWDGLVGPMAKISGFRLPDRRNAHDAPAWIPSTRLVSFRELASFGSLIAGGINLTDPAVMRKSMEVSGYSPDLIRINLRLPPDLFALGGKGIPVDLNYRYTPRPVADKSSLNVNIDYEFLEAYPLEPARKRDSGWWNRWWNPLDPIMADGAMPAVRKLYVPLYRTSSRSQLQFHFFFDANKQGDCTGIMLDNVRAGVDPNSTLDLSGFSHFIQMPDLGVFANAGFPFSKYADLAETAVIIPDQPSAAEYRAFFGLMGRMGETTGYPVTRVSVAPVSAVKTYADRDLLLVGGVKSLPVLQEWHDRLPWSFSESGRKLRFDKSAAGEGRASGDQASTEVRFASEGAVAFLAGLESPLQADRSVVIFSGSDAAALDLGIDALLDPTRLRLVHGSLVLFRGGDVTTVNDEKSYYVGSLPPLDFVRWYIGQRPLWLVVSLLIAVVVAASLAFAYLRARAGSRLES